MREKVTRGLVAIHPRDVPKLISSLNIQEDGIFNLCSCFAHDLIERITKSHRYQLTAKGQRSITALLATRRANTPMLFDADKAA